MRVNGATGQHVVMSSRMLDYREAVVDGRCQWVGVVWVAIDDLPMPVVNFLNAIGVPWPYVNEDTVTEFSSLVRQFGQAVNTTHQEATRHVTGVAAAYKSAASQKMLDGWQRLSDQHVREILDGCAVLADALEVAAGYIVTQKAEALATLVELAAAFFADQAAAVATFGLAEAAVPLIIEGAEKLMDSLIMDLQQYLISMVAEAALKPLFAKVEAALAGLDWSQSGAVAPERATGFSLTASAALAHASGLDDYAAQMRAHAETFAAGIRGLSF